VSPESTPPPPVDRVRELLDRVNEALGLGAQVVVEERSGEILGALEGEGLGLLIGRHGQTIDAVQHLAYKIASRGEPGPRRVVIDAAGYRDRRREILHRHADKAAADAVRARRPVALDAMSATERKVVHEHLKDHPGVETYSEGQEPDRHLVVAPRRASAPRA
jgi:spoIIIJ-associated protein